MDGFFRTLRRLSAEPWLHLVLKPHPRLSDNPLPFHWDLSDLPNVEIAKDTGSVTLVAWADAVIVLGSSIAMDVLSQNKPHLNPAYLHDNRTVFQEAGAEWTVHDEDELVCALKRLSQGEETPYGQEQVSIVMDQLVLADTPGRDVLAGYVDFIIGGWREHPGYVSPKL